MMGHRQELKSGDEVDAIHAKQWLFWRPGERKSIKRKLSKRARRNIKHELKRLEANRG